MRAKDWYPLIVYGGGHMAAVWTLSTATSPVGVVAAAVGIFATWWPLTR